MIISIGLLVLSLGIILAGAELFTNGIEWFGRKLQLAEGAVGSVLAAVGTALPETMIPIIAILFGKGAHSEEIGVGAILGAPLMLSTLAMFVTGLAVLIFARTRRRSSEMRVDHKVLGRDLRTFFVVYVLAIGASFLPGRPYKVAAALVLIGLYVYYVRQTFRGVTGEGHGHELGRLHFHRRAEVPRLRVVVTQVFAALVCIIVGAHLFVQNLSHIATVLGMSAFVLSTIVTPIATELPEKFNSVTWVRKKKDTLALGNISGAMVFQSSILPALGLMFTPWVLSRDALATAVVALVAAGVISAEMAIRKRVSPFTLLLGIVFYAAYLVYVFAFEH